MTLKLLENLVRGLGQVGGQGSARLVVTAPAAGAVRQAMTVSAEPAIGVARTAA